MFSRRISYLLFFVLSLVFSSCGLNVNEDPQPQPVVEVASSQCLDESFQTLKNMLASEAYSPSQDFKIDTAFTCIQQMVRDFSRHVQGENKEFYTPDELTYFINKQVLNSGNSISFSLVSDFLKLKSSFLGGSETRLSKTELQQLQAILQALKPDVIALNKHMPVINQKRLPSREASAPLHEAKTAWLQLLNHFAQWFKSDYDLNNLYSLIYEMQSLGWINPDTPDNDKHTYIEALINLKQLITSKDSSNISLNEIQSLIPLVGKYYFHYLEYKTYFQPLSYHSPEFAQKALQWIPDVENTLKETLNLNTAGFMNSDHFLNAYSSLFRALNKREPLSSNSARALFKTLWSNILNTPKDRLNGKVLPGFNVTALERLDYYLSSLLKSDVLSSVFFISPSTLSQSSLIQLVQAKIDQALTPEERQTLFEIKAMISSPAPLTTQKYFLKILDPYSSVYNYTDLQLSNLSRMAVRLVTESYAHSFSTIEKMDTLQSQLTLLELEMAFNQIKNILVELDLLTQNTSTFMSSRFQESNLFLARSNGDQLMSFYEGHDLALHLISGTLRAREIRPYIVQNCLPHLKKPVRSDDKVDEACLLETYYRHNQGFEFLPQYALFKSQISEKQSKEFFKNLLIGGGYIANEHNTVLMEDADRFPHVVQYVEMLYALYDFNRDGKIVKDEALKAFPLFKELIKKTVASMDGGDSVKESELPGVFIYFLKYGRAPEGLIEKLQFKWFISNEKKWVIESTRYELAMVFRSLAGY